MITMSFNGTNATLLEDDDFSWKLNAWFQSAFNDYLKANYGITEAEFKEIIKDIAPEKFI